MSTAGPTPYNSVTHPIVKLDADWNRKLEQDERGCSYIIRKNGSYYEAIKGGTSTGAGTIVYGGALNAGSTSGSNASAVINAAIQAEGGIFIKKAAYSITATILYNKPVNIDAEIGTVFTAAFDGNIFTVATGAQGRVKDLEVDGNNPTNNASAFFITKADSTPITLQSLNLHDFKNIVIYEYSTSNKNLTIKNCVITTPESYALYLRGGYGEVLGNTIDGNPNSEYDIFLYGCNNYRLENNFCRIYSTGVSHYMINIGGDSNLITINKNTIFLNNPQNGFQFGIVTANATNIDISHNNIVPLTNYFSGNGININDESYQIKVVGNTIQLASISIEQDTTHSNYIAIQNNILVSGGINCIGQVADRSAYIEVSGNIIAGSSLYGINVAMDEVIVSNNLILNAASSSYAGINIYQNACRCLITGNIVQNCYYGIREQAGSDYNTISLNRVASVTVTPQIITVGTHTIENMNWSEATWTGSTKLFTQVSQYTAGGSTISNFYNLPTTHISGAGHVGMCSFYVPVPIEKIIKASAIVRPTATDAAAHITLTVGYGRVGEVYQRDNNADSTATYSLTQDRLAEIDLLPLMDTVLADDVVGVRLTYNDIAFHYVGVQIEYVK
jgi:hypothetical protein